MSFRIEKDSLGNVKVPAKAYYGSFTARAKENFQITGQTMPPEFWQTLGLVKKAAAITNKSLGQLDKKQADAITKACDEFIAGKFDDEIVIDKYQAGAGTPFNMNANEILANRANEILGGKKGNYEYIHPNNHINMSQSTNDLIPTVGRIAALKLKEELVTEIEQLTKAFTQISKKCGNTIKIGRTHLEDAVPIKIAQEFNAFASSIKKNIKRINQDFDELHELGIGGTAIGSGINTHPEYAQKITENLSKLTKFKLKKTTDFFEISQSMNAFVRAASALKIYAIDITKIANDLKILNMGPKGGINEINLPKVQPGSSIMPGKVNPSIEECIHQIAYQVMGYEHTITLCAQSGQLQLNVMGPLIILDIIESLKILINGTRMWRTKSISGIKINHENINKSFNQSLCMATALNPYLGYEVTTEIVKEALQKKKTIHETVIEKKFMANKDLEIILSPNQITQPHKLNKKLVESIQQNKNYQLFKKNLKIL